MLAICAGVDELERGNCHATSDFGEGWWCTIARYVEVVEGVFQPRAWGRWDWEEGSVWDFANDRGSVARNLIVQYSPSRDIADGFWVYDLDPELSSIAQCLQLSHCFRPEKNTESLACVDLNVVCGDWIDICAISLNNCEVAVVFKGN